MNARILGAAAMLLVAVACSPQAPPSNAAATANLLPRTSWGDPRLEGTYTNKDEYGTPFERPDDLAGKSRNEFGPEAMAALVAERRERAQATAGRIGGSADNDTGAGPPHWYEHLEAANARPWFVSQPADGRVPALTEQGRQRAQAARSAMTSPKHEAPDSYTDMSLYDRCVTLGFPGSMMPMIYGNAYQITQSPGFVAIRYEMVHETRVIPVDGTPRVSPALGFWMGDARGHWEGETLVVETTNIREASAFRSASDKLKIVERFKPVSADEISWEVGFVDPDTWSEPWAFEMPLKRSAEAAPFEYACHEGNHGLRNILSAARAGDAAATAR